MVDRARAVRRAGGIAALMAGFMASACGLLSKSAEVHYRVSVTIAGPQGTASGSAVWSWRLAKAAAELASAYDGRFRGEAIPVELPDRRIIYAILRGGGGNHDMASMMPEHVFGDIGRSFRREAPLHGTDRVADLRDIAGRVGEKAEVPCDAHPGWCPMLVEFPDPLDAATVRRFQPAAEGRTVTVTIEITDEDVSQGLAQRLPWLPRYHDRMFDGSRSSSLESGLAGKLSAAEFSRGL
jgi:hypothetical protein